MITEAELGIMAPPEMLVSQELQEAVWCPVDSLISAQGQRLGFWPPELYMMPGTVAHTFDQGERALAL